MIKSVNLLQKYFLGTRTLYLYIHHMDWV